MSENQHPLDRAEAADPSRPDRPRDEQGRFASRDVEPEIGRQAEAHNAGRRTLLDHKLENEGPDPDPKTYSGDERGLREAAADLQARKRSQQPDADARQDYVDRWRKSAPPVEPLPDDVVLSREEGAKRFSALREQDRREATARELLAETESIARDLGTDVDMSAQGQQQPTQGEQQPTQGEQQRVSARQAIEQAVGIVESDPQNAYALIKHAHQVASDPSSPADDRALLAYAGDALKAIENVHPWVTEPSAQTDPEAARANAQLRQALENPVVRQELQSRFSQAEAAEKAYVEGLQANTQHVLAAVLAEYPELVGVPESSLAHVMRAMPQERAQKAAAAVQRVQQMNHQLQQIRGAQQQIQQQEWVRQWDQYSRAQDQAFDARHPELKDPKVKAEVIGDIYEAAEQLGISRAQVHEFYNTPQGRSAAVQEMLYLAAKQHRGQKAMKSAAREARKPTVPPMRPGVQAARPHVDRTRLDTIDRQLETATGNKALRLATEKLRLLKARR
jgi:hypothetical protein